VFIVLFLGFTVLAIYHAVKFHIFLRLVSETWKTDNRIKVFGVSFKSHTQMYGDIFFLNNLWIGKGLLDIPLEKLSKELTSARGYLRQQFLFGFLAFLSVVLNGIVGV
jgi:hypothetical protein